jgi:hypothetical protein
MKILISILNQEVSREVIMILTCISKKKMKIIIMVVYVDDLIITSNIDGLIQEEKDSI